jgi:hypothetical protein
MPQESVNVSLVNYHNLNGGCITFARLKLFCVVNSILF